MPKVGEEIKKVLNELPIGVELVAVSKFHSSEDILDAYIDYSITAVTETKLMGVYHYQEAAPEGYTKVNKDNA